MLIYLLVLNGIGLVGCLVRAGRCSVKDDYDEVILEIAAAALFAIALFCSWNLAN